MEEKIPHSIIAVTAAIVLLITGIILSFMNHSGPAIATYAAAIICFVLSAIHRFEWFEGLGVKAKVRKLEEITERNEETIDTLIAVETDPEDFDSNHTRIEDVTKELGLRPSSEIMVNEIVTKLRGGKHPLRDLRTIALTTGHSYTTIESTVHRLYDFGYLNKAHSKKRGILWALSPKGMGIETLKYEEKA